MRAKVLQLVTYVSILPAIFLVRTLLHAEGEEIRLIVRGDDLGMTEGSLVAFESAFNKGILTCGSVIVCAPWFEAAAGLRRVILTGAWESISVWSGSGVAAGGGQWFPGTGYRQSLMKMGFYLALPGNSGGENLK
jgi:hypothetical protein